MGSIYTYNPITRIADRIEIPDINAVTSSYKIINADNKKAIVWTSADGDNYSIQSSLYLDNGNWTSPITLFTTANEAIIQYMDVAVSDSGTWNIIMNTSVRDINETDESPMSSLVFATVTQKTDTELVYVYANQKDSVSGIQPVSFSVKNLGESVVQYLRVNISSGGKNYFNQIIPCNIEPREEKDFKVDIDTTDMNTVTDIIIFVASEDELEFSNNNKIIQLGQVDVSIIDLTQHKIGDNIIVTAQISNNSATPANTIISVIEDSLDGNVLDVKDVGVINNGNDYIYIFKVNTTDLTYDEFDRKVLYFKVDTLY